MQTRSTIQSAPRGRFHIVLGRSDGWRDTLVYGCAHLGKSLFWYGSELLFAFYLTELVGLAPARMGVVLGLGLLVSAGLDLLVGATLRRHLSEPSPAAGMQFVGSILCAVAFVAVFLGFWVPEELRFAYAIGAGLMFRFAYALYDLPQNALMALATRDVAGRNRVASTRIWFSGAATLLVAAAIGPLIVGRDEVAAWLYVGLAIAMALPAIVSAGLLARLLGGVIGSPTVPASQGQPMNRRDRHSMLFWLMIGLMLVTSLLTPFFSRVEPFFAAYVLRSPTWGGLVITGMAVGIMVGQPVWKLICEKASRVASLAIAAAVQLVGLSLIGLAPGVSDWGLVFASFAFGLGNGGVGMVLWAAFSEIVAREAKGHEAMAYGMFTAVAKAALALGGLALGLGLGLLDYRSEESDRLLFLMTGLPALGAIGCLGIAFLWSRRLRRYEPQTNPALS